MLRLKATALIGASLLGIFVVHVSARGHSLPIEATGTITMFDAANHIFTFQSDKRARALTIAVGRDCKFFQNGAPAGEWILKKGARVKVSYFSTMFTGNIAVKIESNPVRQNITNRQGPCQGSSGENELKQKLDAANFTRLIRIAVLWRAGVAEIVVRGVSRK